MLLRDHALTGFRHPAISRDDDCDVRAIGEQLRDARERSGLSRRELSQRSGVAERQIFSYEHGQNQPPWDAVVSLARALRLSLDSLAGRRPHPVDAETLHALEDLEEAYQRLARAQADSAVAIDALARSLGVELEPPGS